MKQLTTEELKQVELDILSDFAKFCDKNRLTYFLAYGTLIGAIRHKGFIPWDDDIDIWMPRADYNRLIAMFNEQHQDGVYWAILPTDKRSCHSFVKVIDTRTLKVEQGISYSSGFLGVDIDVFPLDGQPTDDAEFAEWYHRLYHLYLCHFTLIRKIEGSLLTRIKLAGRQVLTWIQHGNKRDILRKAATLHRKYPYETSTYVGTVESCFNFKSNRYKKEWFSKAVVTEFEGVSFKIPVGYHEVLTQLYGDYMQLPSAEQQVTHHRNKTYWRDKADEKV